jgi:hypothetical protein
VSWGVCAKVEDTEVSQDLLTPFASDCRLRVNFHKPLFMFQRTPRSFLNVHLLHLGPRPAITSNLIFKPFISSISIFKALRSSVSIS